MKTNFKTKKESSSKISKDSQEKLNKKLTHKEFEEFVSKSGAAGSFMIFRSKNKANELGIDEL